MLTFLGQDEIQSGDFSDEEEDQEFNDGWLFWAIQTGPGSGLVKLQRLEKNTENTGFFDALSWKPLVHKDFFYCN